MRICYNCQHMYFDAGSPGYSEYTPGSSMSMYCNLDVWNLSLSATQLDLRTVLETANHCTDYEHSTNAIELDIPDIDYAGFTHYHSKPVPPQRSKHVQPTCHKCGSVLHNYVTHDRDFVHCPVCNPIESVTVDGILVQPRVVK